MNSSPEKLIDFLAQHQIEISPVQADMLERYCNLLWEWNDKINLTRHTDYEKFVTRDLIDSLAFAEFLKKGETILDVGSGGGVPGIVLAILRPDLNISLVDSVGKKAKVLEDIVQRLGLKIRVFNDRAEKLLEKQRYDTLVIRAVAPLKKLLLWFQPCWGNIGRLLVLKGPAWVEERGEARHVGLFKKLALRKLKSYPLPGTHSESVVLLICPPDRLEEE